MTPFQILQGNALDVLRTLPSESVNCCITSPPYLGLRDYGIEPSVWGGNPLCAHRWGEWSEKHAAGQFCSRCSAWRGALGLEPTPQLYIEHIVVVFREVRRVLRSDGTLWLNIGDSYTTNGGHADSSVAERRSKIAAGERPEHAMREFRCRPVDGLKPKDLMMIPARVAIALQEDGWYLRSKIPWLKRNGMPESARDRPTSMVEYIFLLGKSEKMFYDQEAIRIAASSRSHSRGDGVNPKARQMGPNSRMVRDQDPEHQTEGRIHAKQNRSFSAAVNALVPSRVRRNSDWFFASLEDYTPDFYGLLVDEECDPVAMVVNPQPFTMEMCSACGTCYEQSRYRKLSQREDKVRICDCGSSAWVSHFATFPERMVTPCILAGTSAHGACSVCGSPWERVVEKPMNGDLHPSQALKAAGVHRLAHTERTRVQVKGTREGEQFSQTRMLMATYAARAAGGEHDSPFPIPETIGWRPTCDHPLLPAEVVPSTVLDPFAGSGTTGLACLKNGRHFIGCELNAQYIAMANARARKYYPLLMEGIPA